MRLKISALLLCAPAFALACGGGAAQNAQSPVAAATPAATPPAAAVALPKTATCQLISAEEFREVQIGRAHV